MEQHNMHHHLARHSHYQFQHCLTGNLQWSNKYRQEHITSKENQYHINEKERIIMIDQKRIGFINSYDVRASLSWNLEESICSNMMY